MRHYSIVSRIAQSPPYTIVAVGGVASNCGKTTLVCRLLEAFPAWEAIKVTKGHFRSCGKEPSACCVSSLLGNEPIVHSGRRDTYAAGKDTGRFWDSGASDVHWVIATEKQVEQGVAQALERVKAEGVFIEGNSFLKFVDADFAVLVTGNDQKIKPSARRVLKSFDAIYVSDPSENFSHERVDETLRETTSIATVYLTTQFDELVTTIKKIHETS
jgi:molybdopterin-guanine dinucleotide biosynthesis protein